MEAREHIKRFWSFQNKKALGSSFIVFANVYSIALVFTLITGKVLALSPFAIVGMWLALFIIFGLALVINIFTAHSKTIRLMNYKEHMAHSKNLGKLIIFMLVMILVFMLPIIVFQVYGIILLLFSFGGIVLSLYIGFILFFKYAYRDLALAGIILWIFFLFGLLGLLSYTTYLPVFDALSFLIMSVAVILVFSAAGVMMLNEASNEFEAEVKRVAGRRMK